MKKLKVLTASSPVLPAAERREGERSSAVVAGYNEDDCRSAKQLRDWLEGVRRGEIERGKVIDRPVIPDGAPSELGAAYHKRVADLFESLTRNVPAEPGTRNREQSALWLLAHSLDWHRREEKVQWWEFFHLADSDEDDLYLERTAIAGMGFVARMPKANPRERAPTGVYRYPP
jgi:hypothetical protein